MSVQPTIRVISKNTGNTNVALANFCALQVITGIKCGTRHTVINISGNLPPYYHGYRNACMRGKAHTG
jgi:hypothetical protein